MLQEGEFVVKKRRGRKRKIDKLLEEAAAYKAAIVAAQGLNPAMVTSSSLATSLASSLASSSHLLSGTSPMSATSLASSILGQASASPVSSVNSALAALAARRVEERASPQKPAASPLAKKSADPGLYF